MRDIWIVSDTHFGHENIIKYCSRPFKNAAEMDEVMIERWNAVVKPDDSVYHLGDVFMSTGWKHLPRLMGRKRLILGNHDDAKHPSLHKHFQKILMWRDFRDFGLLLTHVPVHPSHIIHDRETAKRRVNVHGHLHNRLVGVSKPGDLPDERYVNVSVEHTNYGPVHIETLRVKP